MTQQRALAAKAAKDTLGCINRATARRLTDVFIPLPWAPRWHWTTEPSFGHPMQEKF